MSTQYLKIIRSIPPNGGLVSILIYILSQVDVTQFSFMSFNKFLIFFSLRGKKRGNNFPSGKRKISSFNKEKDEEKKKKKRDPRSKHKDRGSRCNFCPRKVCNTKLKKN